MFLDVKPASPQCGILAVVAVQVEAEVPFLVENFLGKKSSAVDMVFQKSDKIYFMENLFWDRHSFEKLKLASG